MNEPNQSLHPTAGKVLLLNSIFPHRRGWPISFGRKIKMKRLALLLLLTSFLLGCGKNSGQSSKSSKELAERVEPDKPPSKPAQKFSGNQDDQLAQIDDIREAMFRHHMEKRGKRIYFLAFFDIETGMREDPTDDFMKRFADQFPRVAKESEAQASDYEGLRDKKTGEHGVSLIISTVRWVSDTEVQVHSGYYSSGTGAERGTYLLKKKDRRWVVESFEGFISQTRPNNSWRTNHSEASLSLFTGPTFVLWAHI